MIIARYALYGTVGLAILSVLMVLSVEIDWRIELGGGIDPTLRIWALLQVAAIVVALWGVSLRYLIATWAIYVGMSAQSLFTLWTDIESGVAAQSIFWYVLLSLALLGLALALYSDSTRMKVSA
jgi:hypothetical protein